MLRLGYGSNLLAARIERRLGAASVAGCALRFHKRGSDGFGKCDAFRIGDPRDRLWGALFRPDDRQLAALDRSSCIESGKTVRAVADSDRAS